MNTIAQMRDTERIIYWLEHIGNQLKRIADNLDSTNAVDTSYDDIRPIDAASEKS